MLDKALSFIAPHHCCSCDEIGSLLCGNCINYIKDEAEMVCLSCHQPTARMWLCVSCKLPYERAWAVGARNGVLQRLIGLYKFERAIEAHKPLAELILANLPDLPPETVIVPVPTVASHIRERGYDHILLIAKYIAKKRDLKIDQLLVRKTKTKQRQADAKKREHQARSAFEVVKPASPDIPYLLIDDVVTTGATIKYAAKALRSAGARHVWVSVIAYQPKK